MSMPIASVPLRPWVYVRRICTKCSRHRLGIALATSTQSLHTVCSNRTAHLQHVSSVNTTCRAQTRRLLHSGHPRPFDLPKPEGVNVAMMRSGNVYLPHRRLISLSGVDAAKFLQGLITNNVDASSTSSFYAAFLDARGRVLWDVFVYVRPERVRGTGQWECYIEVDESEAEALKKHLKRHKLRSKVTIDDVEGIDVWARWGPDEAGNDAASAVVLLPDPRAPHGQLYRALINREASGAVDSRPLPISTGTEYQQMRYIYGIPEGPNEILRESALPMECNIDLSSGIDFKKGCYIGQELTIRTKHTGVVRKRILPVQFSISEASEQPIELPTPSADIKQLDENGNTKKGRATGKFIAGIGKVGLALCRLEMMTSMKISAEGGSWKPGMEFGVETKRGVLKVKPVLHDWMMLRERMLWDKNRTRV